jgi:superfamily II DNA/RNA helicase
MRHPINVRAEAAEESQVVPATAQFVYRCHDLDKPEVMARILQAESRGRVMIFCTTKRAAQRVADDLAERGFEVAAIHGDLGQVARERALDRFRSGKVDVLVATDVAARGIDVEGVTHVINHTCPDDEKTYVHRIGRTGRAGASGVAVTFVDWPDLSRWKMINNALGLPFDQPVETYSTSDHLFHDLGIPKEVIGHVGEPQGDTRSGDREKTSERRPRGRRRTGGGRASEGGQTDEREERAERPRSNRVRQRRRLRAGVVVADHDDSDATGAPDSGGGTRTATDGSEDGPAGGTRRTRTRTRRRRSGSGEGSGDHAESGPTADASS